MDLHLALVCSLFELTNSRTDHRHRHSVDITIIQAYTYRPTRFRTLEREVAHAIHPRDNSSATDSVSPSHQSVNVHLSTSVKSLVGVFTVVGVFILVAAVWRFRSWTKRRSTAPSSQFDFSSVEKGTAEKKIFRVSLADNKVEKPGNAVLLPPVPPTPSIGWTPQIRSVNLPRSGVTVPPIAVKPATRSPQNNEERDRSPPPKYRAAAYADLPLPPLPPIAPPPVVPPPTPPASKKLSVAVTAAPRETFDIPPILSPRTISSGFLSAAPARTPRTSFSARFSPNPLPRLMVVATTFTPTMEDELSVRTGETLRLLEQFEDEWCLVQRVGRADAEKGVIPRFCLKERPRVSPQRVTTSTFNFGQQWRK